LGLASMYLGLNRKSDAKEQFEQAIVEEKQAYMKEFLAAEMLMRLYPSVRVKLLEAKTHLEKTIQLQPEYYHAHQKLAELNEILNASDRRRN
jgi:Tfp pilus assembly protein PilF